jgi:1,4-dihydroxy-2-naphthoyl-CoA hydrolase
MNIWFSPPTPEKLNQQTANNLLEHLSIVFTEVGDDYLTATMPVDHRTVQPAGLLHGGASAALAESLGSFGAYLTVDARKYDCVGIEINANHVRAKTEGVVTGVARPIHLGRTTQVWDIRICDERQRLVCASRLTVAVVKKRE